MSVRAQPNEVAASLPGDDVVRPADVVMDRAFTLAAPAEEVWPWLVQLGKRRAGWYFPRSVELCIPRSRRGLRRVSPDWQALAPGDVIPDWGGADATFTVEAIQAPTHLLYSSQRGHTRLTWCLHLTAVGTRATRVHLRLRMAPVKHRVLAERAGGFIDFITVLGLASGLRERV